MRGGTRWGPAVHAAALQDARSVDDVGRIALQALASAPDVARAGIAVELGGGRQLRFLASERLEQEDPEWCSIDGLADVPLVRALLTGQPVLLHDLSELEQAYPHLLERQRSLGTRALAAVPLVVGAARLGALLVAFTAAQPFDREQQGALFEVAGLTALALHRAGPPGAAPDGRADPDGSGEAGARQAWARLPHDRSAPREARRFLRESLTAWGVADAVADDAELPLSELVTNTVLHSGTAAAVAVSLDPDRLRVAVHDGGRNGLVHRLPPPAADDVGGRGLLLVDRLSSSWGSEQSGDGTTVWFEVDLREARDPRDVGDPEG